MAPASPGIGDTTTAFFSASTCRWSLVLSRSVAESSVEVPCSFRWSHEFQVLQGLTSGGSKSVKAEEIDQGCFDAMVKGRLRPPPKPLFFPIDIPFYPMCAKDCSFSIEKAPFRLERMCCLKFGSWMTRPIPLCEIGACLPCELSPRSSFKRKMHVFRPMFYQLLKFVFFLCMFYVLGLLILFSGVPCLVAGPFWTVLLQDLFLVWLYASLLS
ncbi:hypothetical protein GQ457_15G020260 [Hibiscus cannabinus]